MCLMPYVPYIILKLFAQAFLLLIESCALSPPSFIGNSREIFANTNIVTGILLQLYL